MRSDRARRAIPADSLPPGTIASVVATSMAERATSESIDADALAPVLAAASIALVLVARGWVLWSAPGANGDVNQWVTTSPFDWPLAMLLVLQAASALEGSVGWRGRLPTSSVGRVVLLATAWLLVCAAINPSWRAVDLGFHVAGAWALVRTVRRADRSGQTLLLTTMTALGAIQAVLGIAQSRAGNTLGLWVFEFEGPLYTFGGATAGRGSLTHPYHLTALLIVCVAAAGVLACRVDRAGRWAALVALGSMAVAIPLTFSRAVVLALVPMLVLWGLRRHTRVLAALMLAGLLVGGLLGANGISAKTSRTVDVDQVDSGRRQRVVEAVNLVEEQPVFGVGPGRYVIALREVDHEDLLPPHNLVLHATAEAGIPGGVLTVASLVAFGLWVLRRRSAMVLAVAVSLLPFHLLDSYPHVFPVGLLISGMWVAVVAIAAMDDDRATTQS